MVSKKVKELYIKPKKFGYVEVWYDKNKVCDVHMSILTEEEKQRLLKFIYAKCQRKRGFFEVHKKQTFAICEECNILFQALSYQVKRNYPQGKLCPTCYERWEDREMRGFNWL